MIDIETYKHFLGIATFPQYCTSFFNLDLTRDYVSAAEAVYDWTLGKHILRLPSNCDTPLFLLYHELTHIYDMDMHMNGEKNHDFCLTGYMEYHASQVELMLLMGATKINDIISFSMSDIIICFDCSVQQYLEQKLITACNLICDEDCIERGKGVGVFFNLLGLKSICCMFATDYCDNFDCSKFAERLPSFLLFEVRKDMQGWIEDVEKSVMLYSQMMDYIV